AHGIALELPTGWDGRIWTRAGGGPVLHAANVALPATDGDFATRATGTLPADGVVVVLVDYGPEEAGAALFANPAPERVDPAPAPSRPARPAAVLHDRRAGDVPVRRGRLGRARPRPRRRSQPRARDPGRPGVGRLITGR